MKTFNKTLAVMAALPVAGIIALGGAGAANATVVVGSGVGVNVGTAISQPTPDPAGEPAPETTENSSTPTYVDPLTGGTASIQPDGTYIDSATGLTVIPEQAAREASEEQNPSSESAQDDAFTTENLIHLGIAFLLGAASALGVTGLIRYFKSSSHSSLSSVRERFSKSEATK